MPAVHPGNPKPLSYLIALLPMLGLSSVQAQTSDGPVICRSGIVQVVSPVKLTASQCRSAAKEVIAAWNFDLETMQWTNPERVNQPVTLRILPDDRVNPNIRASANPNGRFTVRLSLIDDPSLLPTFAHELGHIQADRTMGSNVSKVPDYYFEGHGLLMNWLYSGHIGRDHHHFATEQAKTIMKLTPDVVPKLLTDPDYEQKHISSMERLGFSFIEYLRIRRNPPDAIAGIREVFELIGRNQTFAQAFSKTYHLSLNRAIQDLVDRFQQTQASPADRLKGTCFEPYLSQ